jgi:hypothetical protein
MMIILGGSLVALAGLAAATAVIGRMIFQRQVADEIDALLADARPTRQGQ